MQGRALLLHPRHFPCTRVQIQRRPRLQAQEHPLPIPHPHSQQKASQEPTPKAWLCPCTICTGRGPSRDPAPPALPGNITSELSLGLQCGYSIAHLVQTDPCVLPRDEIASLVPAAATFSLSGPFSFLSLFRSR